MYRLVTIDVALPISFGAKEPGLGNGCLGNVCLSISVHMCTLLIILNFGLSGCVFLYTEVRK